MMPEILFEDRDIIVAVKPRGVSSQSEGSFEEDMVSLLKKHIGRDAYIGVVHRLDKPVYGIMVYGKTKNAASTLSKELRENRIEKIYEALVEGTPEERKGTLKDFLKKDKVGKNINISLTADRNDKCTKEAVLNYEILSSVYKDKMQVSRLRIKLITGRYHQIRLQCAVHGFPLFGDYKYNKRLPDKVTEHDKVLALAAVELNFIHPVNKNGMSYKIETDF